MIEEAKNKSIESLSPEEPTTVRAVSGIKNEYHFSGSGKWKPMNVVASNIDEATQIFKAKRVLISEETKEADKTNEQ